MKLIMDDQADPVKTLQLSEFSGRYGFSHSLILPLEEPVTVLGSG